MSIRNASEWTGIPFDVLANLSAAAWDQVCEGIDRKQRWLIGSRADPPRGRT